MIHPMTTAWRRLVRSRLPLCFATPFHCPPYSVPAFHSWGHDLTSGYLQSCAAQLNYRQSSLVCWTAGNAHCSALDYVSAQPTFAQSVAFTDCSSMLQSLKSSWQGNSFATDHSFIRDSHDNTSAALQLAGYNFLNPDLISEMENPHLHRWLCLPALC